MAQKDDNPSEFYMYFRMPKACFQAGGSTYRVRQMKSAAIPKIEHVLNPIPSAAVTPAEREGLTCTKNDNNTEKTALRQGASLKSQKVLKKIVRFLSHI